MESAACGRALRPGVLESLAGAGFSIGLNTPSAILRQGAIIPVSTEMSITIPKAVKRLLQIVNQLHEAYPKKKFTLDGRLVGDIGEILVEASYDIKLSEGLKRHHDGTTTDGRLVQIKATMKNSLTFPADHVPDYYLGIKVHEDGSFSEVFNGPGAIASQVVKNRKPPKTNLHSISIRTLATLNSNVTARDRIPLRPNPALLPTPLKLRTEVQRHVSDP